MLEKWTGDLVGKMHTAGISCSDLAKELDVSLGYVSMILNGKRTPPNIQQRMEEAVDSLIRKKEE